MIIHPYKFASKSAHDLAKAIGCKVLKDNGPAIKDLVILNWGSSDSSKRINSKARWINSPDCVKMAGNKLATFQALEKAKVPHVPYTTSKEKAESWRKNTTILFARQKLSGHSGQGIVIVRPDDPVPNAPLYTLYVRKESEYRVHVFNGKVIDVQAKRRKDGAESSLVRSHANGYVFCREGVVADDQLRKLAIDAVQALGLVFGAVDVVRQTKTGKYFVLEINTAPGLEGTTVESYAAAVKEFVHGNN